jgi:Fur family transcriptional regulator, iron response regulator
MKTTGVCLAPAEIERKLNDAGVNPTAQRIAICRYVLCEADHPTAEQVKTWVDKNFPKMSLATVYNTLNILVGAGLLQEIKTPHGESSIYDCNTAHHHHFVDEASGKIIDIHPSEVSLNIKLAKKGLKVKEVSLFLKGAIGK